MFIADFICNLSFGFCLLVIIVHNVFTSCYKFSIIWVSEIFMTYGYFLFKIMRENFRVLTDSSTELKEEFKFANIHTLELIFKTLERYQVIFDSQNGMTSLIFLLLSSFKIFPRIERDWNTSFISLNTFLLWISEYQSLSEAARSTNVNLHIFLSSLSKAIEMIKWDQLVDWHLWALLIRLKTSITFVTLYSDSPTKYTP